ncbi:MAG: hypothetical protein ISR98_00195 [Parcubacteria group bacterium]|nr:hypothetical protein [Parcubacteria group bacterium]
MDIANLDTSALDTAAKFFRTMQKAGANLTGPMQDRTKRRNFVEYLEKGCPKINDNGEVVTNQLPEGHELARLILGDDYITPEEMAEAYSFNYTEEQLEHFENTLPDMEKLLQHRQDDSILYPQPSVEQCLVELVVMNDFQLEGRWFNEQKQKFAHEDKTSAGGWLSLRKNGYPGSFNETWQTQKELLSEDERVPNVAEAYCGFSAYHKIRGVWLLKNKYLRTLSVSAGGRRVDVGGFGGVGLSVGGYWDGSRGGGLGVSSARK